MKYRNPIKVILGFAYCVASSACQRSGWRLGTPDSRSASGDQNDQDLLPGRRRCNCSTGLLVAARFLGMAGPVLRVSHLVVFTRIGLAPFPVEEVWTMPNGRLCGTSGKSHEERES